MEIIVNRNVRVVKPFVGNPQWWQQLGYGGAHYVFELADGTRIHSNNVWHIRDARPDEPDTAKLVYAGSSGSRCGCPKPFVNVTEAVAV